MTWLQCLVLKHDWSYWRMVRYLNEPDVETLRICYRCGKVQHR